MSTDPETWIFGYGSLIWSPGFSWDQQLTGYVSGWARRFHQGSPDHRGTPQAPGRVVTLIPAPNEGCWGVAYRPCTDHLDAVLATLDHRESAGYQRAMVTVAVGSDGDTLEALTYIAHEDNPQYLGPASLEEMAAQIVACGGPSGRNRDYLIALSEALRARDITDPHVEALEAEMRRRQAEA